MIVTKAQSPLLLPGVFSDSLHSLFLLEQTMSNIETRPSKIPSNLKKKKRALTD